MSNLLDTIMRVALAIFLIGICTTLSHADDHSGQLAPAILDKAAAILEHADVFATAHTGFGGGNTSEEAWAFTAILRHSPNPEARFLKTLNHASPAGTLYCMLGLREIKSPRYSDLRRQILTALKTDDDKPVNILFGDSIELGETVGGFIEKLDRLRVSDYILDPLPDFFSTRRTIAIDTK
ncbi:MAG TPA: hypothetical protein VGP21_08135 [Opitutaceae bacterium]|nr:hypothetical protein [Opitutaceae bacterium]